MKRKAAKTLATLDFDAVVARGKAEIIEDVLGGIVHCDVRSFSDLHDYVDANGYGGLFEAWYEGCTECDKFTGFWNRVQDTLDDWIVSGTMKREAAAREALDESFTEPLAKKG